MGSGHFGNGHFGYGHSGKRPLWETAILRTEILRMANFEDFLRTAILEKIILGTESTTPASTTPIYII